MASRRGNIQRPMRSFNLRSYLLIHLHTFFASLGRFSRAPFNFMMTVGVIAITLSLPSGLLVSINNLKSLSGQVDLNNNISLFLNQSVNLEQATQLTTSLANNEKITQAILINKNAALEEFRQYSGFGSAISVLEDNPLPHVIQITPIATFNNPVALKSLVDELKQQNDIQLVQMDMGWLDRLNGILNIAQRGVSIITILLGLAVLLIVSNTIRLELQNRQDEIDITRLVGATRSFIMRPFIYSGFWYGFLGGVFACILVNLAIWLIDGPASSLANLYNSAFNLTFMPFSHAMLWILFSIFLGISGSWIVVSRYLSELEN
ncbi:MAG: permease-like cell division protein FtsX [Cycloclasticus sp.]|jgi:cell division transport system permease protein|nr:MAG: ABC transporter permease [Cycloclasticus sp. Phe_18]MBV1913482.1 permease-like cell division protein FtsX [Cycloclasticus sp.]MDF1689393.1 permease-like cell division protein FtsX [Cycloclasticus sp.]MEE4291360.1 permease-like cell division protein FtsX [Cycloclasticus sp.]